MASGPTSARLSSAGRTTEGSASSSVFAKSGSTTFGPGRSRRTAAIAARRTCGSASVMRPTKAAIACGLLASINPSASAAWERTWTLSSLSALTSAGADSAAPGPIAPSARAACQRSSGSACASAATNCDTAALACGPNSASSSAARKRALGSLTASVAASRSTSAFCDHSVNVVATSPQKTAAKIRIRMVGLRESFASTYVGVARPEERRAWFVADGIGRESFSVMPLFVRTVVGRKRLPTPLARLRATRWRLRESVLRTPSCR